MIILLLQKLLGELDKQLITYNLVIKNDQSNKNETRK